MPSYTLAALSGLLYDALDGNMGLYPQAQVTNVLNDAVRKLNILTGIIENTVPALTQANQLVYSTPAGILVPIKIYYEDVELEKFSLEELGTKYRNWATDTTAAYGPVARWAPIGISQFVIHPVDATGGRLLEVQGVAPITPMTAPASTVELNDEDVPTLIDFCRGRIQLKIGGQTFANASVAYSRFIREVKDMVIWESYTFPRYWIESEGASAEGEGA